MTHHPGIGPVLLACLLACLPGGHAAAAPLPPMPSCDFEGTFAGTEVKWRAPTGQMVEGQNDTFLVFTVASIRPASDKASPHGTCPPLPAGSTLHVRVFKEGGEALAELVRQGITPGMPVRGRFTLRGDEHWTANVLESIAPLKTVR